MKATTRAFGAPLVLLLAAIALTACGGGSTSAGTSEAGQSTSTPATPTTSTSETEEADPSARARLIGEADAICRAHRSTRAELEQEVLVDTEALNAKDTVANRKTLADDLRHAVDVAETELEELRDLPPPPGEGPRLHRIILAAQAGSADAFLTAEAIEMGNSKTVEEAIAQTRASNERARRLARDYGFEVCGQDSE